MEIEHVNKGNIFDSIPGEIDDELFSTLIELGNVKIERIISKGHASPQTGWYDGNHNEWVIVLKREAIIELENKIEIHLTAGGYLNIPARTKHKVTWTPTNTETVWLAVHY